jgi:hypothetical protein
MGVDQFSHARFEIEKARCRSVIREKTIELAMLEILQAEGGEMEAIDLVEKLVIALKDLEKSPRDLCKSIGFEPDEIVGLRSLQ